MAFNYPSFGGPSALAPTDTYEKIRQQLLLLAHAEKCRRLRGTMSHNLACPVSYCDGLQKVLRHINQCRRTRNCLTPHCSASRDIMTHYKICRTLATFCPVCDLLKSSVQADPLLFPEDLFEAYGPS